MRRPIERDWPGLAVACGCIALGGYVLWEAQSFTRFAAIFPRGVALVMMLAAAAWIGMVLIARAPPSPTPGGSLWRSLGLIGVAVAWAALIPVLGFLVASVLGFLAAMLLAKYDGWSPRQWLGYAIIAGAVVGAVYALFRFLLHVPL